MMGSSHLSTWSLSGVPAEHDTTTVKGLLAYCRLWLEATVSAEQLSNPCLEMANRLKVHALKLETSLEKSEELCQDSEEPMLLTLESYEALAELLSELPDLAESGDREAYADALEEFELLRQDVLAAGEALKEQMSEKVARCPRCGEAGPSHSCQSCALTRLYPDSRSLGDSSWRSAKLTPSHQRLFVAYSAVLSGRDSVESILVVAESLKVELKAHALRIRAARKQNGDLAEAFTLAEAIFDRSIVAIELILSVRSTRRTANLNDGWQRLFDETVALRRLLADNSDHAPDYDGAISLSSMLA